MIKSLFLILFFYQNLAKYPNDTDVVILTRENYDQLVLNSNQLWLINYYATWCPHCTNLVQIFIKVAQILKGIVKIGAVNHQTDSTVGEGYLINNYPTIIYYSDNKYHYNIYQGKKDVEQIVKFCLKKVNDLVNYRYFDNFNSTKQQIVIDQKINDKIIELNDDNFVQILMESDEPFFLKIFSKVCQYCIAMEQDWNLLPNYFTNIKIANYEDNYINKKLIEILDVQYLPKLVYFPKGKKSFSNVVEYKKVDKKIQDLKEFLQIQIVRDLDVQNLQDSQETQQDNLILQQNKGLVQDYQPQIQQDL